MKHPFGIAIAVRTHANLPARVRQAGVTQITADPGERHMVPHLRSHIEAVLENIDAFLPSEMEVRSLMGGMDLFEKLMWTYEEN